MLARRRLTYPSLLLLMVATAAGAQSRHVHVDEEGRRHTYVLSETTGKATRIHPSLDARSFAPGDRIDEGNVELVSRAVLARLQALSGVDGQTLELAKARRSRIGMWIVSFDQYHQGIPVHGARYGVTIGRHNTVLSVGGDVYDVPRLETTPRVTAEDVMQGVEKRRDGAVVVGEPRLMIYPSVGSSGIQFSLSWVVAVADEDIDHTEVVVDAMTGEELASRSLMAYASYSRTGTVDGPVYPRNDDDTRADSVFANLETDAFRLDYGIMDTDETDESGDYGLSWTSATANHRVLADLEGEYVSEVTDNDNTDISFESATFSSYSGTTDWTWSDSSKYADQLNLFFHTNRIARWYDDNLHNVTYKLELEANGTCTNCSAKISLDGSHVTFSDAVGSERQADIIYHEYAHSVSHDLHGSYIGSTGQAGALEEGMADYFAQTLIGDSYHALTSSGRDLDNLKTYPDDYDSTGNSIYTNGLIPAGSAWDLRTDIGAAKTDSIIFAALEMDSPRANTFEELFDNVLLADDDIYGNGYFFFDSCGYPAEDLSPHTYDIWDAFDGHGMPSSLLSEDPSCPEKPAGGGSVSAQTAEGAHPNPFNPSVTLRYRVPEPGSVTVVIYSVAGQVVRELSSEQVPVPGYYVASWDGTASSGVRVASGMYIARVKTPSTVTSFKVSLVR